MAVGLQGLDPVQDVDAALDAALAESFPASDPPSLTQPNEVLPEVRRSAPRARRGRALGLLAALFVLFCALSRRRGRLRLSA